MKVGQKLAIRDPLVGVLCKVAEGGAVVSWGSTVDVGNNVKAIGRDLNEVVLRKAKTLEAFHGGLRAVVIHYYASGLALLKLATSQLTIPDVVDELYFVLHENNQPRVVPYSILDEALASEIRELREGE